MVSTLDAPTKHRNHLSKKEIYTILFGTELYLRLKETEKFYKSLNKKEDKFCKSFNIHCMQGCGKCCERFIPDITAQEALYLAFGLIIFNRDEKVLNRLDKLDDAIVGCPLYRKNNNHHCSIYRYRPLICRLFGASATELKNGHPYFQKCKWNMTGKSISSETLESNKKAVITMDSYGLEMDELNPSNIERKLLPEALKEAVYKIRLILELKKEENC